MMSTTEPSSSVPPNSPTTLPSTNTGIQSLPHAQTQNTARDVPNPESTSTKPSRPDQLESTESTGCQVPMSESAQEGSHAGLGTSTPMPPVPPPSSPHVQHAQDAPSQSPLSMVTHPIMESPLSFTSSAPPLPTAYVHPTVPRRPSSPPLPSPPVPPRPPQVRIPRSNTSVASRSLSFVEARPPSRAASASAKTNNEHGSVHHDGNGSRNPSKNVERRAMSSITASMEKAGMIERDNSHVYHIDLDYEDRFRDSRYHDSRITMQAPISAQDRLAIRDGFGESTSGGGGRDDNGKSGATSPDKSSDSIGVPRFPRTVQERLQPTINHAMTEEAKYARKARITAYALNCAIGLQVFISALITALSAVTTGRRTQIMTSVLGGAGTIVASYLARARGSNEPELSITRTKDLQRFVRTCDAFVQDHGQETGFEDSNGEEGKEGGFRDLRRAKELDDRIRELRTELEHLLGYGDGERRLSPPV